MAECDGVRFSAFPAEDDNRSPGKRHQATYTEKVTGSVSSFTTQSLAYVR